ncbi:serine/threonine-protein kinase [Frankia sp. Cppng1_Ct_nod]|uniref:serine/threonine-protein kinase n=1 Tax=Frankia sp. Cppng1_Ct_nod TaxID=2897162 RepID=UPI002023F5E0|nr:serine/threonine-protein kinase [Frankia sp. Cppng1_Ct_nod]
MRRLGSRYVLHEPLGRGASGEVWRGERVDDGTGDHGLVAVKVLRPELADDPEIVDRFLRERRVLLAFDDPHLVKVRDIVAEGNTLAIVMDLVDGVDLRGYLRQHGSLPDAEAVELVSQVLTALAVVHEAGVVHRDVKPANIMVDATGPGGPRAMLTDFGIARLTHGPSVTRLSGAIGTPMYMAPELAEHTPASAAADLYGAGVVLYELLAGRPPFTAPNPIAMLRAHAFDAPPPIDGLSEPLWDALRRLLAKRPTDRPASAQAARAVLAAALPPGRSTEVDDVPTMLSPASTAVPDAPPVPPPAVGRDADTARMKPFIPDVPARPDVSGPHATPPLPAGPAEYEPDQLRTLVAHQTPLPGALPAGSSAAPPTAPPTGVPIPPVRTRAPAWTARARVTIAAVVAAVLLAGLGSWALAAGLGDGGDDSPGRPSAVNVPTPPPGTPAGAALGPAPAATTVDPTSTLSPPVSDPAPGPAQGGPGPAGPGSAPAASAAPSTANPVRAAPVPNVRDMVLDNATTTLRNAGFSNVPYEYDCYRSPNVGNVVRQDPAAGTRTALTAPVHLYLQANNCATVANVVGMTLDDAAKTLKGLGFSNIPYVYECLGSKSTGTVVTQAPASGTSYGTSQPVNLKLQANNC